MDLRNLIWPRVDLERLCTDLDELGHEGRLWSVHQWGRQEMAGLWEATAAGVRPLLLEHFVPSTVEPFLEVIHHGKNSLPVFQFFQKRFCRPRNPELGERLFGYNAQALAAVTGPGYFVARAAAEGAVCLDFTTLPSDKPSSWPHLVPNTTRLARFVYGGMLDVMHRVSSHVTVGRTRRREHWEDSWFVLVREDPQPQS
jgi:hypothetical protein